MSFLAVVDYGAGNLMSVTNALRYLGIESVISSEAKELEKAAGIILPGVGAFPAAMKLLKQSGLDKTIIECAKKKPLLGICLGMQMLLDSSDEIEHCKGLGLISGHVSKIETSLKLPHIGWNSLEFRHENALLKNVSDGSYVYFVHSFCASVAFDEDLVAEADYGTKVAAIVSEGNVFGCQFHPEKSGEPGLQMLCNFNELTK